MKTALLFWHMVLILACAGPNVWADEASFYQGTCRNVTHSVDGLLKLYLLERADGTLDGYMSISGWLVGSGRVTGTKTGNTYQFKTADSQGRESIKWEGVKGSDKISGEYYTEADGQAGEWNISLQSHSEIGEKLPKESFEQYFMLKLETDLNSNVKLEDGSTQTGAQALFSTIHPVGTGISVSVDSVGIEWKDGASMNSTDEIRRYTIDYTLYWSGIVQSFGHSKLRMSFNVNLGRITAHDLISTTGTTKTDVEEMAFGIGVLLGKAAMESLLQGE